MTPIGDTQRSVLRALAGRDEPRRFRRPYPGGGWVWDNHSTTVRILDRLVIRGLVRKDGRHYKITADGCRMIGVTPGPDEMEAEQLACVANLRAQATESAHHKGAAAAAADAQACKMAAHGTTSWRSREHQVPTDPDERAAWMRGYGQVFAHWGGDTEERQ